MSEVEERPWGEWKVVHEEKPVILGEFEKTVKVLTVNPGCMLSLQSHKYRDEYWVPLDDGLVAYIDARDTYSPTSTKAAALSRCKVFAVKRGERHRLINPTAHALSVVEIILGEYDEGDIKRFHDAYGR